VDELPVGWVDEQENGRYRLAKGEKESLFGYVVGPHSWKKYLYPPTGKLLKARRNGKRFEVINENPQLQKLAFIGVRPCELSAINIQDKILLEGPYVDPAYRRQRRNTFIVAVNCTRARGTCFCTSMKTGPRATGGFDLALTEVIDAENHYFVIDVGSKTGAEILKEVPSQPAGDTEIEAAERSIEVAAANMGRNLETDGIRDMLFRNFDSPHWEEISSRCLTCGNCTMVCPTCFCTNVEDVTDLAGNQAERRRLWDSCYSVDFSYIHGGSIRATGSSRYRQWMMHKLAYWLDQFGVLGCVGCGRCITWCPVGIDITEEATVFREGQ
jgi:ferredoxin